MPKIHPTAVVDPAAQIADDVEIGPYCVVEADVAIGPSCRLESHAIVRRYTSLGQGNVVGSFTVLGQHPQDLKFKPETVSRLEIGDFNTFREHCSVSRATGAGNATRVGSHTFWMTGSHAGHEAAIGDHAVLVNNAAVAGHCTIGPRVFLSSCVSVHQFTWVGRMVMTQGLSVVTMHIPPYVLMAEVNRVQGLNVVGLRRSAELSDEDRRQIREAFDLTYRSGLTTPRALEQMDACTDWRPAADEFRRFVRAVLEAQPPFRRGLCPFIGNRPSRGRG